MAQINANNFESLKIKSMQNSYPQTFNLDDSQINSENESEFDCDKRTISTEVSKKTLVQPCCIYLDTREPIKIWSMIFSVI